MTESATTPDPAERVVAILKRELPGFASMIHARTDTIRVSGPLKLGATFALDTLYAVRDDAIEAVARSLIDETRRAGIEALGLETTIVEREREALRRGKIEGYEVGMAAGIAEGRKTMLAEILAAKPEPSDIDDWINDVPGSRATDE